MRKLIVDCGCCFTAATGNWFWSGVILLVAKISNISIKLSKMKFLNKRSFIYDLFIEKFFLIHSFEKMNFHNIRVINFVKWKFVKWKSYQRKMWQSQIYIKWNCNKMRFFKIIQSFPWSKSQIILFNDLILHFTSW